MLDMVLQSIFERFLVSPAVSPKLVPPSPELCTGIGSEGFIDSGAGECVGVSVGMTDDGPPFSSRFVKSLIEVEGRNALSPS